MRNVHRQLICPFSIGSLPHRISSILSLIKTYLLLDSGTRLDFIIRCWLLNSPQVSRKYFPNNVNKGGMTNIFQGEFFQNFRFYGGFKNGYIFLRLHFFPKRVVVDLSLSTTIQPLILLHSRVRQ